MKHLFKSAALIAVLATPSSAEQIQFKVLGQPTAIGKIFDELEKPFFENFGEETGLDAVATFTPIDTTGIKDIEGLRIAKTGLFDIVSLRFSPISRDAPVVLGLDLVGQNPDYKSARESTALFLPDVEDALAEQFDTKLLGIWPFGPQVLFCKSEFSGLDDMGGKKVRTNDQSMANFVSSLGGTAVPMAFPEVQQALQRGVLDCAITGPSAANLAGWTEVTKSVMPLGLNMAFNGYGMNLNRWNALTSGQQEAIQTAFGDLSEKIWIRSEELYDDAQRCNAGQTPCELRSFALTVVEPAESDLAAVNQALKEISFPNWKPICDDATPGCSDAWLASVGEARGF